MRKSISFCFCVLLLSLTPAQADKLATGTYSRFHQNKNFKIIPLPIFDDMTPIKDGIKLINSKDNLTITIISFLIDNPKDLSDIRLLNRFNKADFRDPFFNNINNLSNRKVDQYRFKKINGKDVFEFSLIDKEDKIKPLKSIIFYEFGKEYRITLEAQNNQDLENHAHFINDCFSIIGIIR